MDDKAKAAWLDVFADILVESLHECREKGDGSEELMERLVFAKLEKRGLI